MIVLPVHIKRFEDNENHCIALKNIDKWTCQTPAISDLN